ncbi:MEX3C ligase, partial [Smithornis capensis]|nr:MEX3C ligase [Smithornis capensis]
PGLRHPSGPGLRHPSGPGLRHPAGPGLRHPAGPDPPGKEEEEGEGDAELEEELMAGEDDDEEEEDDDDDDEKEAEGDAAALLLAPSAPPLALLPALGSVLLPPGLGAAGPDEPRGAMAAVLPRGPGAGTGGEPAALLRRKSVNTTECVPVPSSEHVAEIVGRQGCKIKALRAKTNTYIKTPIRGEEPVFVVTGRREDVAMAKREILSAAEHFSMIRASRNKNGPALGGLSCVPTLPGQTTVQVRVPYHVVGLVVGPKGATIKRIQQQTHTYIVTPSRDKEPVFEVTGMPENVDRAREEIEMHIAMRTGSFVELSEENDFHYNGTDVGFEGSPLVWGAPNPVPPARARMVPSYRNDSSSSLGSGSTDSYFGSSHLGDFSPTSPFSTSGFWFGEPLPSVGTEDPATDSLGYDPLPTLSQAIWTPFEPAGSLPGLGDARPPRRDSQPSTPRLSPTFPEGLDPALGRRVRGDVGLPIHIPAFSSGTNSYSSSNGGSASSSPPESRRRHDCMLCYESQALAALVPCGHTLFCLQCAHRICGRDTPTCPVCQVTITQAIQIHC